VRKLIFPILVVLVVVALIVIPGAALADTNGDRAMYFLSAAGDDANTCARTDPCATEAGVLVRIVEDEEIDVPPNGLPERIAAVAGVAISLSFSFIPGLSTWYSGLDGDWKRWVMCIVLVLVTAAMFGLSCWSDVEVGLDCDGTGAWAAVNALIVALAANQATYLITPKRVRY
jgi:hypothetical protein